MVNVCIVVLDAVRAANLSCYGHSRPTTPNIDSVADESVVFERAISPAPVTLDSTASLFTGLYPGDHRAGQRGTLDVDVPHLPELLADAGHETGAVTTNPFVTPGFGFDQGVDRFDAVEHRFERGMNVRKFFNEHKHLPSHRRYLSFLRASLDRNFLSHVGNGLQFRFELFGADDDNGATETTRAAASFFDDASEPWFLYAHYSEAHMKDVRHLYKLPRADRYRFVDEDRVDDVGVQQHPDGEYPADSMDVHERLYDGSIRYLDRHVGRLVDDLKERGEWDDTLFAITADHGECLGEYGAMGHGHLYEPGVRVPLVVKPPAEMDEDPGRRDGRVNTLGLYATVAELVGADADHAQVPSVFADHEHVLTQDYSGSWSWSRYGDDTAGQHALYVDDLKLIRQGESVELYDTTEEEFEAGPPLSDHPRREELVETLDAYLDSFDESTESIDRIDVDESASQRLEDLGYL